MINERLEAKKVYFFLSFTKQILCGLKAIGVDSESLLFNFKIKI